MAQMILFFAMVKSIDPASAFSATPAKRAAFLPDRLIIKFSSSLPAAQARNTPAALTLPGRCNQILDAAAAQELLQVFPEKSSFLQKSISPYDLSSIYEIRFGRELDVTKIASRLRAQPGVVYVEPLYLRRLAYTPNDPAIALGQQDYLTAIKAREGWDISRGDSTVIIAIIDSGVDWQHEDLKTKIWSNPDEIPGNANDDDGNGFVDDARGWDFGGHSGVADNDPREDRPDHGTHVAGIAAAATDNATGIAGIAFNCKIMPIKVTRDDFRPDGDLAIFYGYQGIVYAADNGASIINCSWGGETHSQFEQEVINYANSRGALVVAAAGNSNSSNQFFPAAYQNVLSVGATNNRDIRTGFSNYGHWVGVSAPGESIYSTWQNANSPYVFNSGTSMSSPMAAGVCALLKSLHKDWSPQQIAQQVRVSADNIDAFNPSYAKKLGFGRINVERALTISSPAVRWTSMTISEITGDQDGVIDPGEDIGIKFTLTNYLQTATNLQISASTTDANVAITQSQSDLGTVASGDTVTSSTLITFRVAADAAVDHRVEFLLSFNAGGYADWQAFDLTIKPASVDVHGGNVAMTLSSFGALGYVDYAGTGESIGLGFQFPAGSPSALYHGGFIVATGPNRVSDVSYGRSNGDAETNPLYDFVTSTNGDFSRRTPGNSSVEIFSRFNDSVAESPIGVEITQTILAWNDPPNNEFVILQYIIQNKSASALEKLYAGIYLDWDIGLSPGQNYAGWDGANQLGYMYAANYNYYGICALSPASSYRVLNFSTEVADNQYTDPRKYQYCVDGFLVTEGVTPSDWSQQIGVGPFSLQPGASDTVAFALLGGASLDDLKANAQAARQVDIPGGGGDTPIPQRFELAQNVPNPFQASANGLTVIPYSLAKEALVQVKVFNLLGQEVAVLREARQSAGRYSVGWTGRDAAGAIVPSGIYFYQVLAGNVRMVRRMVVLR
jgi:hypothetical protein